MEFKVEEDPFPIVDLSIQLPEYDLESGSAAITLSHKGIEGRVYIKRNEIEEIVRELIHNHFSILLEKDDYIAGIYNERQGPIYPLDVIIRLPRAFISQIFYVYVIKKTAKLEKIKFDINTIFRCDHLSSDHQSKVLSDIFRKHGFVKCELPSYIWNEYAKAKVLINDFFNLPEDEKKKYSVGQIGFIPKSRREIFHLHESLFADEKNFPAEIKNFRKVIKTVFNYFREISISILLSLTLPLGYPREYILSLIDTSDDFWLYATSFRLFRYNPVPSDASWSHVLQCEEHADTALLTLSPSAVPSEVEMVDRRTGLWVEAEKDAREDEFLVFVGVYLAWLTGGYYLAPLHRVNHTSKEVRISTPFFLRSPKDAILKREYLSSDILPNVPRNEQSVGRFVNSRDSLLPRLTDELRPYEFNN